jgi:hypothetical protein
MERGWDLVTTSLIILPQIKVIVPNSENSKTEL